MRKERTRVRLIIFACCGCSTDNGYCNVFISREELMEKQKTLVSLTVCHHDGRFPTLPFFLPGVISVQSSYVPCKWIVVFVWWEGAATSLEGDCMMTWYLGILVLWQVQVFELPLVCNFLMRALSSNKHRNKSMYRYHRGRGAFFNIVR